MSEHSAGGTGEGAAAGLRARLERSRTQLLTVLGRLTEQDFASEIEEGRSVLDLLAGLAPAERTATAAARAAAGLPPRAAPRTRVRSNVLAPQVVHDLAGARHETLLTLEALAAAGAALDELLAVADREERAAEVIRARFGERSTGA